MKKNFEKYPNISIIEKEISALEKRLEKVRKVMHEVELRKSIFFLLLQNAQQKIKSDFGSQILDVKKKYSYELKRARFFSTDLKKIQNNYRAKIIELNEACRYQMEQRRDRQKQDLEKLQQSFDICKKEELSVKEKIEELKIQLKERWEFEKPKVKDRSKAYVIKIKEARIRYKKTKKNVYRECKLLRRHLIKTFRKAHPYYHFLSLRIKFIRFKNITKLNNNLYSLLVKLNEINLNKIKGPRQDYNNYLNLKNEKRFNEAKVEAITFTKVNNEIIKTSVRLSNMKYVLALKSAFFSMLPLIFLSSFFILLNGFILSTDKGSVFSLFHLSDSQKETLEHLKRLGLIVSGGINSTFSIILAAAIAWSLSKYYSHIDGFVILFTTVVCMICSQGKIVGLLQSDGKPLNTLENLIGNVTLADQWSEVFGRGQMIIAIFVGLTCPPLLAKLCIYPKLRIILPNDVPSVVTKVFNFLLPVTIVVIIFSTFSFVVYELGTIGEITINYISNNKDDSVKQLQIYDIQDVVTVSAVKILGFSDNSLGRIIEMMLVEQFLWFFGFEPQTIVHGIVDPILIDQSHNTNLVFTSETIRSFLESGGGPSFLAICFAVLLFTKRRDYRMVAWISILPCLFNISEPIAFGLPLTYNILFIIPMILTSIFLPIYVWIFANNDGNLQVIHSIFDSTTISDSNAYQTYNLLPFFIMAGITVKSQALGVLFSFSCVAFATAIYSPFIIFTNYLTKQEFIENMINEKQREQLINSQRVR